MSKNQTKKFEEEPYAAAQVMTDVRPSLKEDIESGALYELPAVLKMAEGGWGLYMLTIRGGRVLDKLKLHGPDIRRVCLAKAIRLLEK